MQLIKRIPFNSRFSLVKPTTLEDDYQLLQCLGQGSTSRVYLSLDVRTNQKVIVKLFKKVLDHKIQRESRILKLVRDCPNVQQLKQIVQNKGFMNYGFVFHYYPGEMLNKMIKQTTLEQTKVYIKQLLNALKCIHKKGVMHRDIKPSNILISDQDGKNNKKAILIDFGLAEIVKKNEVYKFRVGTNCYKPPQILLKRTTYDQKMDIWGIGLILAQMLLKIKPLFKYVDDQVQMMHSLMRRCNNSEQVMTSGQKKTFGIQKYRGITEPSMSQKGINLALRMMNFNPARRPSAQQALQDEFFN